MWVDMGRFYPGQPLRGWFGCLRHFIRRLKPTAIHGVALRATATNTVPVRLALMGPCARAGLDGPFGPPQSGNSNSGLDHRQLAIGGRF